jgi:hypothetical protein
MNWRCGLRSRVPALQVQNPEFKFQSHTQKKGNIPNLISYSKWPVNVFVSLEKLPQQAIDWGTLVQWRVARKNSVKYK